MLSLRIRQGNKIIKKVEILISCTLTLDKRLYSFITSEVAKAAPSMIIIASLQAVFQAFNSGCVQQLLKLNTLLSFYALLKSMFDHGHFGHRICDFYHFRRGIAPRHN